MAAPIHQAVERLVDAAAASTPAGDAMLRALRDSLIPLPQTPQGCASVASRLVRQQMPLSVGEILCQRFAEDASGLTLLAALEALEAVLSVLSRAEGHAVCSGDALRHQLRQQLQDSGYLRVLPQLLDTAMNLPATPLPAAGSPEAEACRQRMLLAALLLNNHRIMINCWPYASLVRSKPAVRAAALATAALGFVDAAAWRQSWQPSAAAQHILTAALSLQYAAATALVGTVLALLQTVCGLAKTGVEPELCSLVVRYKKPLMWVMALLFCKQVDAGSSSGSSGSSGSSSSSMRAHQQREGSAAGMSLETVDLCYECGRTVAAQMPKAYSAYVNSLGLSGVGTLYASKALTDMFGAEFCGLTAAYVMMVDGHLLRSCSSSGGSSSSSGATHSDSSKRASLTAELNEHSLLAPALLQYALKPPGLVGTAVEVHGACSAALAGLHYACALRDRLSSPPAGQFEWRLPLDVVEAAVQSLTELLTRLQQLPSSSSSGGGGSASSAGGSSSDSKLLDAVAALGTCVVCLAKAGAPPLVELQTYAAPGEAGTCGASSSTSAARGAAGCSEADCSAWVPHAAQLCVLLEACVRTIVAAGSQRMPEVGLQLLNSLWTDVSRIEVLDTGGHLFNVLLTHADLGVKEERQMYALAVTLVKASAVLQQEPHGFDVRAARAHALAMTVATPMVQRQVHSNSQGQGPQDVSRVEPWVQLVSRGLLLEPGRVLVAEEQQQGPQVQLAEALTGVDWSLEMLGLTAATLKGVDAWTICSGQALLPPSLHAGMTQTPCLRESRQQRGPPRRPLLQLTNSPQQHRS